MGGQRFVGPRLNFQDIHCETRSMVCAVPGTTSSVMMHEGWWWHSLRRDALQGRSSASFCFFVLGGKYIAQGEGFGRRANGCLLDTCKGYLQEMTTYG
jgi:hypothetical protein